MGFDRMEEIAAPVRRKFILFLRGQSPIKQEGSMLAAQFACPNCNKPVQIQFCNGGSLLQSAAQLRELFERIGTQISIATKDVLASAKVKEVGDLIVEWCNAAEVGDARDVLELSATITRIKDDTSTIDRIESKPMPKLVFAGGDC